MHCGWAYRSSGSGGLLVDTKVVGSIPLGNTPSACVRKRNHTLPKKTSLWGDGSPRKPETPGGLRGALSMV
jgi:hypothetical protein